MPIPMAPVTKIDVKPEWWDNIFAPSSCLVLITTVDREGRVNAAAFGTCTRVCHDPMYIAFTCSADRDTTRNVLASGEFVVNVVPFEQAMLDKVPVCGLPFAPSVNELEKASLTALPSRVLRPPDQPSQLRNADRVLLADELEQPAVPLREPHLPRAAPLASSRVTAADRVGSLRGRTHPRSSFASFLLPRELLLRFLHPWRRLPLLRAPPRAHR